MTGEPRRAWEGSQRWRRLPPDWAKPGGPRDRVFARPNGRKCALRYERICIGRATQVDHIRPGDDHSDENLQPACAPCHAHKSAMEGAAARLKKKRRPAVHPALR